MLRPLSKADRALVFAGIDLRYLDAVREMEGGVAYAIPCPTGSASRLRKNLDLAAEHLGLALNWAPIKHGGNEIVCELAQ